MLLNKLIKHLQYFNDRIMNLFKLVILLRKEVL